MSQQELLELSLLIAMFSSGIVGGYISYILGMKDEDGRRCSHHIVLGIGASFLVPLFLSLTSSDLIARIEYERRLIWVFVGFCLVAAISSVKFITSISSRVLKKQMETMEGQVKKIEESKKSDGLYWEGKALVDSGEYEKSLDVLNKYLKTAPENASARLLKAFALKRTGDLGQALKTVQEILDRNKKHSQALYRRACYKNIIRMKDPEKYSIAEILDDLAKAFEMNDVLKKNSIDDPDFSNLKDSDDFKALFN